MLQLLRPRRQWRTPGGDIYSIYEDIAAQPHALIAGATGSGKSVAINGIICNLLHRAPSRAQLILIDPKRVELAQWRRMPHTIGYASEPDAIPAQLTRALEIIDARYSAAARRGEKTYTGSDLYIIIDELADLMTTDKRRCAPLIQRIGQIGRAARVHLIAATQCPLASVIPTAIKVNLDARLALRTRSAQDSRNIIGCTGCEQLPRYGYGYFMKPEGIRLMKIPAYSPERLDEIAAYWKSSACQA